MKKRKYISTVVAVVVLLALAGVAAAFGVGNVDGVWQYVEDEGNEAAECDTWASVTAGEPDVPIDAIGAQVGSTLYPTATDQTRTRLTTVCSGEVGDSTFATWNSSTTDTFTGLGSYTGCTSATGLIFSEYVYNQRDSNPDYIGIEIWNGTGAAVALGDYSLRLYTNSYQYTTIALNNVNLANGDVYVLVNAAAAGQTTQEDQTFADSDSYRTIVLFKEGTASTVTNRSTSSTNAQTGSTTDENQVRYGRPVNYSSCPDNNTGFLLQSGFGFDGINGVTGIDAGEPFYLGSFTHYNNPIYATEGEEVLEWVDLTITVPIDCDNNGTTDTTFPFYPRFALDETPNSSDPCAYPEGPNAQGCSDRVLITQPTNPTFTCGGVQYTVNILGFTTNEDCETVYDANAAETEFLTRESFTNQACLWAEIQVPNADAGVAKTCTGFDGQDPHYVVTVTNAGPGTALGAKIVDNLPSGVTFASYTSQRTVNNVTTSQGTCTVAGQVVTCNLNAALPNTTSDPTAKWVVDFNVDYAANATPLWVNNVTLSTTSTDTNSTNNTASATCTMPTAVELLSFTATPDRPGGIITLAWTTTSEVDNLGFNLYRATAPDGERTLINPELIPAQAPGTSGGAAYTYIDPIVGRDRNAAYYYWLESVDVNYGVALSGPIEASLTGKLQIQEPPTR